MRGDGAIWCIRIAVLLPLLVPGGVYLMHVLGLLGPSALLGIAVGSILIGGIPYALFALVALAFLWNRTAAEYARWAIPAPVIFVPVLVAFLVSTELLGRVTSVWDVGDMLLVTVPVVLVLGYFYVGVFYIIVRVASGNSMRRPDVSSV